MTDFAHGFIVNDPPPIDARHLLDALEQEALTVELEGRHIDELNPPPLSALWLLGCFKLVIAESLLRVARAVREGVEA